MASFRAARNAPSWSEAAYGTSCTPMAGASQLASSSVLALALTLGALRTHGRLA